MTLKFDSHFYDRVHILSLNFSLEQSLILIRRDEVLKLCGK